MTSPSSETPRLAGPVPFFCVVCKHRPDGYYGRLVFPEEMASGERVLCPNHPDGQEQELVPA